MRVAPAQVHAHQHLRPVLRLGAAGAGLDIQEGAVRIHLAGKHALKFELLEVLLDPPQYPSPPRARWIRRSSSTAIVEQLTASLSPLRIRSSVPTICSSFARSRPSSCALSGVFQIAGIFQFATDFRRAVRSWCRSQRNLLSASLRSERSSMRPADVIDFHWRLGGCEGAWIVARCARACDVDGR